MPQSMDDCVSTMEGKVDNPYAFCNWAAENAKGPFAAAEHKEWCGNPGCSCHDEAALLAEWEAFCQEGENKGKPGPCPEEGKGEGGTKEVAAAPAPAVGGGLPAMRAAIEKAGLEM